MALTVALTLGLAAAASRFGSSAPSKEPTPEACVWTLLRAEQEGQWDVYASCFADPLDDEVTRRASNMRELRRQQGNVRSELQGVSMVRRRELDDDRAELTMERIYRRYNTRQTIQLRRVGRSWKIELLGVPRRFVPEIAYGTPVQSADATSGHGADHDE